LLEKLKKLEDMKQLLHGALHAWSSQLQQQRHALVVCFALGDVDSLINATASDAAALAATSTPVSNVALQTASIDTFIHMMTSPPSAPTASATAAPVSVAACVKFSRENLLYAAVGCRTVLVREAAAAASAVSASAGVRVAVESEIAQLRQQIQEQQQQMKQHEEQQVASMKLHQVRVSFVLLCLFGIRVTAVDPRTKSSNSSTRMKSCRSSCSSNRSSSLNSLKKLTASKNNRNRRPRGFRPLP
jgi:hypothetical protein